MVSSPFVFFSNLSVIAGLFSAGGMGLWHGVEYYEEEKLKTDPWKASWDEVMGNSRLFTVFSFFVRVQFPLTPFSTGTHFYKFCV